MSALAMFTRALDAERDARMAPLRAFEAAGRSNVIDGAQTSYPGDEPAPGWMDVPSKVAE